MSDEDSEFHDERGDIFIKDKVIGRGLLSLTGREGTLQADHRVLRAAFEARDGVVTFRPDGSKAVVVSLFLTDVPPNLGVVSNVILRDIDTSGVG